MRKKLPLYAGFAKADITPPEPRGMDLFGMPRLYPGARGVLDRLYARACYLESGARKFLLIECDLVLTKHEFLHHAYDVLADYDTILDTLARAGGLERKNIWLCATHCHSSVGDSRGSSGPFQQKVLHRYTDLLTARLIAAGRAAVQNRQRVKIGYGQGEVERVAGNRRAKLSDGVVVTGWADGPSPPPGVKIMDRGRIDKNVGLVMFTNMKNRPMGTIVNYNSHIHSYPMLYFSSELAGAVAARLDKKLPGLTTVYTNGAEGNTSLCANLPPQHNDPRQWNRQYLRERERMSSRLVEKVLELYRHMKFESLVAMDMDETILKIKNSRPRKAIEPIRAVTINDLALVGEVEEIFVEYALGVKQGSPYRSTFVVGMNGVRNFYFPTTSAMEEGGYEAYMWIQPGSFERTVAASVKLLQKMRHRR
jgi:hypothetical protein